MAHTTLRRAAARTLLGALLVSGLGTLPATTAAVAATQVAAPAPTRAHALDPGLALTGPDASVIVTGGAGVAGAVRDAGGRVLADLPLVGGVSAVVPAASLRSLADDAEVGAVTADREGEFVDFAWDDVPTASTFTRTVQAVPSWTRGTYGKGVGVAVLDTGVSPLPDLAGRLVHGPDLSGEGTLVDSYGHGTVMAGLIAGNGATPRAAPVARSRAWRPRRTSSRSRSPGRNGVVDVSTILEAMHWISAYREQFGIRVLNLSWGVASTQSPSVDPINHAVQRLWSEGIVVVVAAGNSGSAPAPSPSPATTRSCSPSAPTTTRATSSPTTTASRSGPRAGPTAAGLAKPDLVAPGRTVGRLRSPGSTIERNNPKALLAPSYIRGSAPRRPPPCRPAPPPCCSPTGRR
jgi:serine protease AprX